MNILLIGYYGHYNVGDDVLCRQTETLFKSLFENPTFTLIHPDEKSNRSLLSQKIKAADLIVASGGSLFQNKTSNKSLVYYLGLIVLAKFHRKKVLLLGQGYGPISGGFWQSLTHFILSRVEGITVRDTESLKEVANLNTTIKLGADLWYSAPITTQFVTNENPKIGLALSPHGPPKDWLHKAIHLIQAPKIGLSFDSKQDPPCFPDGLESINMTDILLSNHPFPTPLDCVVCMRYHAAVWASLHNIPFIVIGHDPKLIQIAKDCGQEWIYLEGLKNAVILSDLIDTVLSQKQMYQDRLKEGVQRYQSLTYRHKELIKKAIQP